MRFLNPLIVIALTFACLLAVTLGLTSSLAGDADRVADADKVYPISYRLSDLPVWSQDGESFNPKIFIAYLRASSDGNRRVGLKMAPSAEDSYVVVATTSAHHGEIRKLLDTSLKLPNDDAGRE